MRMLLALLKDFLPSDSESQFLKFRQFLFTIINNKKTLVVKKLGGQAPLAPAPPAPRAPMALKMFFEVCHGDSF